MPQNTSRGTKKELTRVARPSIDFLKSSRATVFPNSAIIIPMLSALRRTPSGARHWTRTAIGVGAGFGWWLRAAHPAGCRLSARLPPWRRFHGTKHAPSPRLCSGTTTQGTPACQLESAVASWTLDSAVQAHVCAIASLTGTHYVRSCPTATFLFNHTAQVSKRRSHARVVVVPFDYA